MATTTVTRGYVLVRDQSVSGVVSKSDADAMKRRFGGRIVNAAGLAIAYRAQGIRVLTPAAKATAIATR